MSKMKNGVDTVTEKDLRENFTKVAEDVEKSLRETEISLPLVLPPTSEENDYVVEPVYAHRIHASS